MLFMERSPLYVMPKPKTGENDLHELCVSDCGYNEGAV